LLLTILTVEELAITKLWMGITRLSTIFNICKCVCMHVGIRRKIVIVRQIHVLGYITHV